jgi:L-ascorbate metabolism protein UlaG (beta-lactamase superfamily)
MIFLVFVMAFIAAIYIFMQMPQFGKVPEGERLERIKRSPHYKDGQFMNNSHTPALTEGASYTTVMKEFFFTKKTRNIPGIKLPSRKTDLLHLDPDSNLIVWFGHSSYFMQLDGKKFLVDPVLSGNASPVKFTTKSFPGSDIYSAEDIPEIDYLFISHDHWDHLDYETVRKINPKVKKVITGLGTGAHLEYWGYDTARIMEKDWNEHVELEEGFTVHVVPARHFSGRGFKRNGTLWVSFLLSTPATKIFIGGDSGYDDHFAKIGQQFGPIDLAILENGQYDKNWKYIHMMPEEVVQAALDLRAKYLLPVHWSKFSLANHAWDDPIRRVFKEAKLKNVSLVHPMIGDAVYLNQEGKPVAWWENVK